MRGVALVVEDLGRSQSPVLVQGEGIVAARAVPVHEGKGIASRPVGVVSLNRKWFETDSSKDVREIDILEDKKGEDPTRRIQKNDLI